MAIYDYISWFCFSADLSKIENYMKTENVFSYQPTQTAQADPRRDFTQMSECTFSLVLDHKMSH